MTVNPTADSRIVVVGGGFAGTGVASALDDIARVTLVDPNDAFVFNIAALRALVSPEWIPRIFLPYDHLLRRGRIVRDRAVGIEPGRVMLASGASVEGDFVILATGSSYPFPAKVDSPDSREAIARYVAAHDATAAADSVLIVGAGAVGLELAGEIASQWPDKLVTIVDIAADILPGDYRQELRDELRRQLNEMKIRLVLGSPLLEEPPIPAAELGHFAVTTRSGLKIEADIWFRAYGIRPVADYLASSFRTPDGYVQVDEFMRIGGDDHFYAIGDIAAGHPNGAGRAGRQAEAVARNIRALITGEGEVLPVLPSPPAIILPLGPEGGAGQLPGQDELVGPEGVAQMKGRDMMVDRFNKRMGIGERVEA